MVDHDHFDWEQLIAYLEVRDKQREGEMVRRPPRSSSPSPTNGVSRLPFLLLVSVCYNALVEGGSSLGGSH